jgi:hypothetical protein
MTGFNILRIPYGGRYEGMGTAFAAVPLDSGFIDSNPASSSRLPLTELSLLHNNWIADSSIESVLYTGRNNNLGYGAGVKVLYVPFSEYNAWGEKEAIGYYSESQAVVNISYNFLASYYFSGISLGANAKMAYRFLSESIYPGQNALAWMFDFGALTQFNMLKFYSSRDRNFGLALVLRNIGPNVMDEPLPTEAAAAVSWSPLRPLLMSFDYNIPLSFNSDLFPAERPWFAAGMNLTVTDFFSLQSGFRYKSSNPRFSLGSMIILQDVSFILNYTAGLDSSVSNPDHFSLEAKFNLGDKGRAELLLKTDSLYLSGLEAWAKGDINLAVRLWRETLSLDPMFQPASESLMIAEKMLVLEKEMRDLQKVE